MMMMKDAIEAQALELRRKYHREWRERNRDRVREYNRRYWMRRAALEAVNAQHNENVREVKKNDT